MGSYICAVKDKMKNIEESLLAALFISALCVAGADSIDYRFFVLTKVVSLFLFLIVCLLLSKRPLIPWRQLGKVLTLCSVNSSNRNRGALTLAFDKEDSGKGIKVSGTTPRRSISNQRKRRSGGHLRRNVTLEQLSLW